MEDFTERMQRCREYVEALVEERRKIQVFHRELPLCLELVTQAIDACRQQLGAAATEHYPGRSECSEQTSSEGPMFEEFIPIKRSSLSEEEEEESLNKSKCEELNDKEKPLQKIDWLRSVQLWNTDPDPTPKQDQITRKTSLIEPKKIGGAFQVFQRENKGATASSTTTATTTTITDTPSIGGDSCKKEEKETRQRQEKEEKEGLAQRKPRRCWSPELHRRFLNALQQLGGSHTATPKQIRELMKVDGLSNDEVKSHLQKYRLHTRRPRSAALPNGSNSQQPQFVVVGGIWVPPPEYAAVAAATTTTTTGTGKMNGVAANGIYAPVAAPIPPQAATVKQSQRSASESEERRSQTADEKSHWYSPASSSSTHTTTASPPF